MAKKLRLADSFDGSEDDGAPAPAPALSRVGTEHRDTRGLAVVEAVVPLSSRAEYVREISDLWRRAQKTFVDIGRHLNNAKDRIPHGDFMDMIDAELPFGDRVANKLMAVARAIDAAVFPVERLPPHYSIVYELVQMPEDLRGTALRENVIRPDVTRQEVIAFKRRWIAKPSATPNRAQLRKRLQQLLESRRKLDEEIAALQDELGEA